mmetsp:Transcript_39751/g.118310  ORF Transcript_39751/g.118310 Transcript_39751/m.118310 type:complete len:225 (+) Transcript_39751:312-986(+)
MQSCAQRRHTCHAQGSSCGKPHRRLAGTQAAPAVCSHRPTSAVADRLLALPAALPPQPQPPLTALARSLAHVSLPAARPTAPRRRPQTRPPFAGLLAIARAVAAAPANPAPPRSWHAMKPAASLAAPCPTASPPPRRASAAGSRRCAARRRCHRCRCRRRHCCWHGAALHLVRRPAQLECASRAEARFCATRRRAKRRAARSSAAHAQSCQLAAAMARVRRRAA